MADAQHSYWSASRFESLMLCPGKAVLEAGAPDNPSAYAAEGTAAHQVLTWALQTKQPASRYVGVVLELDTRGKVVPTKTQGGYTFTVDEDMAGFVQTCLDYCHDVAGSDGVIFADIRVNYSQYLGVSYEHAWGTADVVIVLDDGELVVVDFKYGRGVEVGAERNPQLMLYALGALTAYQGLAGDFTHVRMAISQPRLKSAVAEWDCSVDELETWGRFDARNAVLACDAAKHYASVALPAGEWNQRYLTPGEKACKFCKAKATCPQLRNLVAQTASLESFAASPDEFVLLETTAPTDASEVEWLSACLTKVDLIEDWCKAVRAEVERRLHAQETVPGYKLVQGRKGARQWDDVLAAEATFKSMRVKLEDMYDFKLISPTSAEKLAKAGTIGPRQWPKLKDLIVQREGAAHVAPETDPRPALVVTPVADDFTPVTDDLA